MILLFRTWSGDSRANMLGTPPLFAWGGVSCVSAFQLYRDISYAKAAKQLKKK